MLEKRGQEVVLLLLLPPCSDLKRGRVVGVVVLPLLLLPPRSDSKRRGEGVIMAYRIFHLISSSSLSLLFSPAPSPPLCVPLTSVVLQLCNDDLLLVFAPRVPLQAALSCTVCTH